MALIGALFITLIIGVVVFVCIGLPYIAIGFGGPTKDNVAALLVGLTLAAFAVYGWWVFVGSNIHFSFG
ncbi:hypothetical protein PP459_gp087 [Streptomyces phage Wakanda]|uniref:Uncharacterized protein n=2 Tax=Wakandavirus TaxID=3044854 RepID=A0A6G8R3C9_9CAUD|nr:hypothetical protein PP459_gp087 [Streptomyces phage Wakanda]YP_010652466.1 hypothetical protein PP460_gp092 [Streptomyces phage Muntaha]QIN94146.1 hypothetical protein SEA_WAKANDA_185 [Streptomyces phage Wakanda]QIN94710.1 hypothetical protein SEA_MUNTAHA_186 [Streptomyces phage Muntaha]